MNNDNESRLTFYDIDVGTGIRALALWVICWCDLHGHPSEIIAAAFIDRPTKARGVGAAFRDGGGAESRCVLYPKAGYGTMWLPQKSHNVKFTAVSQEVRYDFEKLLEVVVVSENYGTKYMITDTAHMHDDLYSYLMQKFDLPLQPEWTDEIYQYMKKRGRISECAARPESTNPYYSGCAIVSGDPHRGIVLHGKKLMLDELIVVQALFSQGELDRCVAELLNSGKIGGEEYEYAV